MLGRDAEVPVVAVSLPARVRFYFSGMAEEGSRVPIPRCHPLTSRCIWQVSDPRERWLHSSGPWAPQELSVCWAISLFFLPEQHWCRPDSRTTHDAELLNWSQDPVCRLTEIKNWKPPETRKVNMLFFLLYLLMKKYSLHTCMCVND